MDAFYSVWSKPYLDKKNKTEYWMHDFELLTMVLSCLMWKKLNGKVSLIADEEALKYLEKMDILRLFDGEVILLDNVDEDINPNIFWAAGKIYALKLLKKPMAMVDLDLICWKNMDNCFNKYNVFTAHRETITDNVYPDFTKFKMNESYSFDSNWNNQVNPCNTALFYADDLDFIKNYTDEAIKFMRNCREINDNLCPMVFAEQRLLSIMADKYKKTIGSVFPFAYDIGKQDIITHIWGHKNILKFNYDERVKYCKKILNRIALEDYSSYEFIINNSFFKEYK